MSLMERDYMRTSPRGHAGERAARPTARRRGVRMVPAADGAWTVLDPAGEAFVERTTRENALSCALVLIRRHGGQPPLFSEALRHIQGFAPGAGVEFPLGGADRAEPPAPRDAGGEPGPVSTAVVREPGSPTIIINNRIVLQQVVGVRQAVVARDGGTGGWLASFVILLLMGLAFWWATAHGVISFV